VQADLGVRVRGDRQVDDGTLASRCGEGTDFDECITVFFDNPRRQRLLLVGSGEWGGKSFNATNRGECRFSVGNNIENLGFRKIGNVQYGTPSPGNLAMNSVTGPLDKGQYEISIDCRDISPIGSGGTVVRNAELAVVAVGDG
jgi:hypothetical protein